jgi:hypothetical protein
MTRDAEEHATFPKDYSFCSLLSHFVHRLVLSRIVRNIDFKDAASADDAIKLQRKCTTGVFSSVFPIMLGVL